MFTLFLGVTLSFNNVERILRLLFKCPMIYLIDQIPMFCKAWGLPRCHGYGCIDTLNDYLISSFYQFNPLFNASVLICYISFVIFLLHLDKNIHPSLIATDKQLERLCRIVPDVLWASVTIITVGF